MAELSASFRRPFREQLAAFRLRLGDLVPTSRWDDIWKGQHDRAFMVAGATKADLLADLAGAVDKAISQGTTLEEFRRDFRRIVADRGWHGWTGEGSKAGENWRTRVIYQTNMRTTYAAGRYAQLKDGGFPFWIYRHSGAVEPRHHHLAWDGLVLEVDHPFWSQHFPPNGWGCGCYVNGARSKRAARRLGGDPAKALPEGWQKISPKTGEPKGIGKGWGYAPGASVASDITSLAPKLDKLPHTLSADLIQSWTASEIFARWLANPVGAFPVGRMADVAAKEIASKTRVVMLSPETVAKQLSRHPEIGVVDYRRVQAILDGAGEVLRDGDQSLIFVRADTSGGYVLVVKATVSGQNLFVTSMRRLSSIEAQRDSELRRLRRKR